MTARDGRSWRSATDFSMPRAGTSAFVPARDVERLRRGDVTAIPWRAPRRDDAPHGAERPPDSPMDVK